MQTIVQETNQTDPQAPLDFVPAGIDVGPPRQRRKWLLYGLACAGLLAASAASWKWFSEPASPAYTVVNVRRGNLATTISATGKVQAVTTVQVGTQVSGTVSELHADFNDRVTAGQVIARLDPSQMEAQLQQAKANLTAAQAAVETAKSNSANQAAAVIAAEANVDRAAAALLEAERADKSNAALVEAGVLAVRLGETSQAAKAQAAAEKVQAEAQYSQALTQVQASKSQLDQAQAQVTQAKAAVDVAAVNLERTIIKAPISGVVVARSVDVGQTVAASLQAPVLFLIAQDLTKMQVLADVDEADVGQLNVDSKVTFTVDAFPAETFQGKVSQVRLSPNVVQNVVTYTAVIDVANPKLQLKPGMTATITATVAEKRDVLIVPNAALRFRPDTAQAPATTPGTKGGKRGDGSNHGATLYKVEAAGLTPIRVQAGMTDGISTEVSGGGLAEGDRVAGGQTQSAPAAQKQQTSPFSGGAGRKGRF